MKRKILNLLIALLALAVIPLTMIIVGFGLPSQFGETYYAVLPRMYNKVTEVKNKKIVIVGTSSVAFGIDSDLMQNELESCGRDYTVCNFGLYGALGTKLMLDLCRSYIREGDIVLFMPEISSQTLSLYFSGKDTWFAADGNFAMLKDIDGDNAKDMAGTFAAFAAAKYRFKSIGGADGSGIYSAESFDGNCDLKNKPRPNNIMGGYYDSDNKIDFELEVTEEFYNYVNDFYRDIKKRGAEMFYCFAPMNEPGIKNADGLDGFADKIISNYEFALMGNPHDAVMQAEWFYDSNFHLNDKGMIVNTARVTEALKTKLGIIQGSGIVIPQKPSLPENGGTYGGDNSDAEYFTYEENDGELTVTGLTEAGKKKAKLTVPCTVEDKPVKFISENTFVQNDVLEEIIIQKSVVRLRDGTFKGCSRIEKIIILNPEPASLSVGWGLLQGVTGCRIYVPAEKFSAYTGDYFWGHYAEALYKYE